MVVPEAKDFLSRLKYEVANEQGVNLKQGYNGDLTSRQAGSVGGQMVNIMTPTRNATYTRENRTAPGHSQQVEYGASITA